MGYETVDEQLYHPEQHTITSSNRLRIIVAKSLAVLALATSTLVASEASTDASVYEKASNPNPELVNNSATYWAGYQADTPEYLNMVESDWIVPTVTCPETGESDVSIWVGVGQGTSEDPLDQTGIRLECNDGTESSYVWWEEYPTNSEQDFSGRTVSAGDKIVAYVAPDTNNGVETEVQDYGSDLSNPYFDWLAKHDTYEDNTSASTVECVVEQPEIDDSHPDLANFDTIDFSAATSGSFNEACDAIANDTDHVISSSQSSLNHGLTGAALTIEDSEDTTLADTSGLSSNGDFTVTWDAAN